ncbi:hypothetical protein B0H17DRAFT_406387 [Mycena rosella]|uniref:Uncharacterized protein n=1 Tax=Mycena rosella TaxID=1033263 RepID=A0AAD7DQU9_MYCRO|nr:hypothetical protein B0H17DRAFT_406387 [Mycena rosella]
MELFRDSLPRIRRINSLPLVALTKTFTHTDSSIHPLTSAGILCLVFSIGGVTSSLVSLSGSAEHGNCTPVWHNLTTIDAVTLVHSSLHRSQASIWGPHYIAGASIELASLASLACGIWGDRNGAILVSLRQVGASAPLWMAGRLASRHLDISSPTVWQALRMADTIAPVCLHFTVRLISIPPFRHVPPSTDCLARNLSGESRAREVVG